MHRSSSHQQSRIFFPKQSLNSASSGSVHPQQLKAEEAAQQANVLTNLESLCCRIKHDKTEAGEEKKNKKEEEAIIPNKRRRAAEIGLSGRDGVGGRERAHGEE